MTLTQNDLKAFAEVVNKQLTPVKKGIKKLEKDIRKLDKKVDKIDENLNTTIKFFDKQVLSNESRIEKLESHTSHPPTLSA